MAGELSQLHADIFTENWDAENIERQLFRENVLSLAAQCLKKRMLVGYIAVQFAAETAEILSIGVKPAYRSLGVGEALLKDCIRELQRMGMDELFLEVAKSNQIALKLYRKLGFKGVGHRRNYFKSQDRDKKFWREDALIMRNPCKLRPGWDHKKTETCHRLL